VAKITETISINETTLKSAVKKIIETVSITENKLIGTTLKITESIGIAERIKKYANGFEIIYDYISGVITSYASRPKPSEPTYTSINKPSDDIWTDINKAGKL
jgi:RecB family exonuclease